MKGYTQAKSFAYVNDLDLKIYETLNEYRIFMIDP